MTLNENDEIDDDTLWHNVTKHIQKLPSHPHLPPPLAPRRVNVRTHAREIIAPSRRNITHLEVGISPDIDKGNAEKLKRGKYPIEGRLDLHGFTREQAYRSLYSFISSSYGQEKRCVLIVTGKGLKEDGSKGVIRTNVPLWLNAPEIRPFILAFRYAKVADGGEGALYVLLKRKLHRD